jgi:hypothetical protein
MEKYQMLRRIRRLLKKLGHSLQDPFIPGTEVSNTVRELEELILVAENKRKREVISQDRIIRLKLILEAFKHYAELEISQDPEVLNIINLKDFLARELGVEIKETGLNTPKKFSPLYTLLM